MFKRVATIVKLSGVALLILSVMQSTPPPAWAADPEVEKILASSPSSTGKMSHFPVPFVYSDWEAAVVDRYGRMSLAQCNERLYEDLPPFKAEHQPVPTNSETQRLIAKDKARAEELMLAALALYPSKPVWSVIAASAQVRSDKLVQPLVMIARTDPEATDRAFAIKELSHYKHPAAITQLHESLFDDSQSIRLLTTELLSKLGDNSGDFVILSHDAMLNPFKMYFMENALNRILSKSDVKPGEFFNKSLKEQIELVETSAPMQLKAFLQLAAEHKTKTMAALALFSMGTEEQAEQALDTLARVLLQQGKEPEQYHSPAFFLRASIISCLQATSGKKYELLDKLFLEHADSDPKGKEILLLALAYSLTHSTNPQVISKLATIRTIKTNNYDLYVGAAEALVSARSKEAFPSLLHILSLKRQPFCTVAMRSLKRLTGLNSPGTPEDLGMLHHLGIPEGEPDVDQALKFWNEWWQKHKDTITYDETTGKFH